MNLQKAFGWHIRHRIRRTKQWDLLFVHLRQTVLLLFWKHVNVAKFSIRLEPRVWWLVFAAEHRQRSSADPNVSILISRSNWFLFLYIFYFHHIQM